MKKGIVMEKNASHLIVMSPDGSFHKTSKKSRQDVEIGEEIEFQPRTAFSWSWIHSFFQLRTAAAIIVLLLVVTPIMLWNNSNEAYAYVNVDINPSIELTINHELEVIDMTPLNEEGKQVVNSISDWKNKSVEKVTHKIIEETKEAGYLELNQDILIGVSYLNENDIDVEVASKIDEYVKKQEKDNKANITTFVVPEKVLEQAHKEKVSMNFLYAKQLIEEQVLEEDNGTKKEDKKQQELEQKIIEKFLKQSDKKGVKLPPGLEKKLDDDHPSNKNKDEKGQGNGKNKEDKVPPGHQKKDEDFVPPGLEKKNEDNVPPGHQKKNNENIPPGQKKKDDKHEQTIQHVPPGHKKWGGKLPPGLQKKYDNLESSYSETQIAFFDLKFLYR